MISDIYTKGYVRFYEPQGLEMININEHKLLNTEERARDNGKEDIDSVLGNKLNMFGQYLHQKYILPEWPEAVFNKYLIWDGVDKDNQGWHTDMFEDYDVFFLYYLDHTYRETGGAINFKWDGDCTESYQPAAGELFMISNIRGFWHKADSTKITRRVCSFDYSTGRPE